MALMVPQTRGNGALDLFNNAQARFFNRALLVELGAHRPVSQKSEMSRAEWATTYRWAQPSQQPRTTGGVRPAPRRPATRAEWMEVPRGTPESPCTVGAAFPQMPSRGDAGTWRGRAEAPQDDRPGTAGSYRRVVGRREKYERPEACPSSLKERLFRVRAEELEERQRLQDELRSASRFCADRRTMQKQMGATALYVPEATLQRTPRVQESARQQLTSNCDRNLTVSPTSMPFSPLRAHTAGPQRGWLI